MPPAKKYEVDEIFDHEEEDGETKYWVIWRNSKTTTLEPVESFVKAHAILETYQIENGLDVTLPPLKDEDKKKEPTTPKVAGAATRKRGAVEEEEEEEESNKERVNKKKRNVGTQNNKKMKKEPNEDCLSKLPFDCLLEIFKLCPREVLDEVGKCNRVLREATRSRHLNHIKRSAEGLEIFQINNGFAFEMALEKKIARSSNLRSSTMWSFYYCSIDESGREARKQFSMNEHDKYTHSSDLTVVAKDEPVPTQLLSSLEELLMEHSISALSLSKIRIDKALVDFLYEVDISRIKRVRWEKVTFSPNLTKENYEKLSGWVDTTGGGESLKAVRRTIARAMKNRGL